MSDDWSLAKHKRSMYKLFLNDGHSGRRVWTPKDYFYLEEDIETLRQTLIEDIKQYCKDNKYVEIGKCEWGLINLVINERFGKE